MIWMRVGLLLLGGLLGVVLIARGAVFIGAIILAVTVLRGCMLVSMRRRRQQFIATRRNRPNRMSGL